jgi:putative membrane-bound dehydrogenase-like protein
MIKSLPIARFASGLLLSAILGQGGLAGAETVPLSNDSKPLPPEAALASMKVPPGYRVELVAAEPLVMDPVAFDWGPDGRLWVAEMRDYPNGLTWNRPGDPLDEPGGRIKVLTDTDGDGRYDEASVFLDGLSYPTGVKVWDKGVLVTAAPEVFYAEDTDGDGKADRREVWYAGFARSNQQHRVNGLAWGLDNWLHVANGDGGGVILSQERREEVDIRGFDLRVNPFTKALEPLNGRTQCGRFRDDWDNWFGCNNSNPLWYYPYPWHLLKRNPEVPVPRAYVDVPKTPGAAPVFPVSPTVERFNDFDRANRFTSACGPAIYRDVLLGSGVSGNAFTCEPVHNLVSRQVLETTGATFTSDRHPDERASEFFASTDSWSRPVSVRTGPDGGLWIADMYRFVIEHPEWIPQEWQKKLDLRAGSQLGRIYRVVPDGAASPAIPDLAGLDDAALVARLDSPNGTVRDLVHQMLLWRKAEGVVALLENLTKKGAHPAARAQSLCVLDGLDRLAPETVAAALADPHPGVVRHAVRLSAGCVSPDRLAAAVRPRLGDAFVAREVAGAMSDDTAASAALLSEVLLLHAADPVVTAVALSSVKESNLPAILDALIGAAADRDPQTTVPCRDLARMAAKWRSRPALDRIVASLGGGATPDRGLALLTGCFEGGVSPADLAPGAAGREILEGVFGSLRETVVDPNAAPDLRAGAVRVLGYPAVFGGDEDLGRFLGLLVPQAPPLLREAAFEALGRARHPGTAEAVAKRWAGLGPADRSRALAMLLSRGEWAAALLAAVESGTVPRAEIDATSRNRFLESKDAALRERAVRLFAASGNTSRAEVLQAHAGVATMKGDANTGKALFGAVCAACHAAEGVGNAVGPDLAALTDRSPGSMLVAILDPNRAVEDKFRHYTITTAAGESVFGLIAGESANTVTVRQADGSIRAVPRNEITAMTSSGVSLMPEGFENLLTKPQLADLIAYVASLGTPAPAAPAPRPNVDMAARVSPGKEGVAELRASRCRLDGDRIQYLPDFDAIGWWTSEGDRAQWTLVLDRPGRYRVELDYSVSPEAAGNRWSIEIGGKEVLSGTVADTGGWETFKSEVAGTLTLPAADNPVVVRSKGPVKGALFDLRVLRFVPLPSP